MLARSLALLWSTTLLAQDAAPAARAVLERHITWLCLGGKPPTIANISALGTIRTPTGGGSRRVSIATDGRMREDTVVDDDPRSIGRDARGNWVHMNGRVLTLSPVEGERWVEQQERRWLVRWSADAIDRASFASDTVDGVDGTVVTCPLPHAGSALLVLGPGGELLATKTLTMGHARVVRYSDWRPVGGMRMPFCEDVSGVVTATLKWDSIEVKDTIDDAALKRPEHTVQGTFAAGTSRTTIPLRANPRGFWFGSVSIAGKQLHALLDTGFAGTLLSSRIADELGMVRGAANTAHFGVQRLAVQRGSETTIEIGDARVKIRPDIADLSQLEQIGESFEMLLGSNLLWAFAACVDLEAGLLTLSDPDKLEIPRNAAVVRAAASQHGQPVAQASVEDLADEWFVLDTASPLPLVFFSPFVARRQLLSGREGVRDKRWQDGGVFKAGRVASLRLGAHTRRDVPAAFCTDVDGLYASTEYAGVVGSAFLRGYRVTFDLRNDRVILEPRDAASPK